MHATLQTIAAELDQLVNAVNSGVPNDDSFINAHNNWSFPGLTKSELAEAARSIATSIRERGAENLGAHEKRLADYVRRIAALRTMTVPNLWGNAGLGVSAYLNTLDGLNKALAPVLKPDAAMAEDLTIFSRRLAQRLRGLENRLSNDEPRSANISTMLDRIEQAFEAADQLPTDLQTLAEDRARMQEFLKSAEKEASSISQGMTKSDQIVARLIEKEKEAQAALDRCHSAYSAATSQGLAAAFAERSKALGISMWVWVGAFVIALIAGACFGSVRMHELGELLTNPNVSGWALGLNLLLAALSVGAPIWFGWLATKQINQRFRLAEDYAFKASVSRAYEGYRREAARLDKDMESKLLASALARLDEQPLRFVEQENHGTPWHELASSELIQSAIRTVPNFADKVADLARTATSAAGGTKDGAKPIIVGPAVAPQDSPKQTA